MIELKNLTKEYQKGQTTIKGVDHVNLTIKKGEIFGIIGYSGAGKSSLLRCINVLEQPTSGQVIIDGIDITTLHEKALRKERLKIGMIFQHFHLIHAKTVAENIAFALKAAGVSKSDIKVRVNELLAIVGLSDKKDHYPSQLSGGQKQRVGIARALANNPKVLLCDEATSALDPSTTEAILQLLKEINEKLGITIVVITHEMDVVKDICHRVAVMENGKVIELGEVYEIFANPQQTLTKQFINTILHFQLPEKLLRECQGTLVKIYFQGDLAKEAIVSEALKAFHVRGNILHGKIEYIQEIPLGIFIMELTGEKEEIERAVQYIRLRTASLEVIDRVA